MILLANVWSWVGWSAVLVVGTVLVALYSGLEIGVYVLNKFRLDLRAEEGIAVAKMLKRLVGRFGNLLAVLLIGTNIAAYATTFAVNALALLAGAGEHAEAYTIAIATPLLFILGESVPKNVFQKRAETLVYPFSWLLAVSSVVFTLCGVSPLVRGFSWLLTRLAPRGRRGGLHGYHEGFGAIVAEGRAAGVLTHAQTVMADRVVRIKHVCLGDVMVPLRSAVWASMLVTPDELRELIRHHNFSRVPLLDPHSRVVGVLDVYRFLLEDDQGDAPVEHVRPPLVLQDDTPVPNALYRIQRSRDTMAIVADRDGRHVGLVTIKDLVEEIVGELAEW